MKTNIKNLKIALQMLKAAIAKESREHIRAALQISYNELDNQLLTLIMRQK